MRITDLRQRRGGRKRVSVFLDGEHAFDLGLEEMQQAGLTVGCELSQAEIDALVAADMRQRCHETALHLLTYRPRTRYEMRDRLLRKGFGQEAVAVTLDALERGGLLDDAGFARSWKEGRQSLSPRSRLLIERELRSKGVASELAGQATRDVDDRTGAYVVAHKKARTLDSADERAFRRRLSDHLRRRGFSYDLVNSTVNRVWQEKDEEFKSQNAKGKEPGQEPEF